MLLATMFVPRPAELQTAVNAFRHAYEQSGSADLQDFLPDPGNEDYPAILTELARVDLRLSWARGRRRYVDDYVCQFPIELGDPDRIARLAREEYHARLNAGEEVQAGEYQSRYGIEVERWPSSTPSRTLTPEDLICLPRQKTRTIATANSRSAPERKSSPSGQMPKAGQRFLHFTLVRELGRGVFGRVFLARQTDLAERPVALKVTPETDCEPQLLARLQHTNIVPIHAVYQAGPLQAICMPYFGSITLAQVIADLGRNSGALPQTGRGLLSTLFDTRLHGSAPTRVDNVPSPVPAEEPPALTALAKMSQVEAALWIAARLADGLAHAHQRGVLHCDLKPANVLVADDGQPMLLDFNVATDRKSAATSKSLRLGGTIPYMAPEYLNLVHNDNGELTPRADLFSLGVVLYELLTGSEPHPISNDQNTDLMGSYSALIPSCRKPLAKGTRPFRRLSTQLSSNSWSQIQTTDTRRLLMFAKIWNRNSQTGHLSMPRILRFVNVPASGGAKPTAYGWVGGCHGGACVPDPADYCPGRPFRTDGGSPA